MSSSIVGGEPVVRFVATLLGEERGFGNCTAIGFTDLAGRLEAGVVYHNWNPDTGVIEMSCASTRKGWCSRERLRTIFAYPFDEVGCQMVVMRVSERNAPMLRVVRQIGADRHLIPRLYGRDEAAFIVTLTAEQWREGKFNGQKRR